MNLLRHELLQAELKAIEEEAASNSYAIMNRADDLLAAAEFCTAINAPLEEAAFHPAVIYHPHTSQGCDIAVYVSWRGAFFFERLAALGLDWSDEREAFSGTRELRVSGLTGIKIYVDVREMPVPALKEAA